MGNHDANTLPTVALESEESFLARLDAATIDTPGLLDILEGLREQGQVDQAESRAELLQDTLAERKLVDEALLVLHRRATWAAQAGRANGSWMQEALDVCGGIWDQKALIDEAGFDRNVQPVEALRRLRLLRSLREGVLCHDRTWGLGVVSRVDSFYKRVEIDFERKLGHQLSFAYAAETLELVDDDHLLVWKRRRPEELRARVQQDPAEVVRMAIRSFGPSTVTQLQAILTPGIVTDMDWKRFWDQARKGLKGDPHMVLPAGRNDALRIVDTVASREQEWFDGLARERDLGKVVALVEDLAGRRNRPELAPGQLAIVRERVAFTVKGAGARDLGTLARVTMAAQALGIHDALDAAQAGAFHEPRIFVETMRQLPAKQSRAFLRYLEGLHAERTARLLLDLLPTLEIGTLNEALAYLLDTGREADCAAVFKERFDNRAPSLEMLSWLGRYMEKREAWKLGPMGTVAGFMLDALEQDASGERLKAQNQLRERFARADWLKDLLAGMERKETEQMLMRVKDSPAWPALDRQFILAQIVKLDPDLAPLLASRPAKSEGAARGPVTSERSFRERQTQLDRIVNVEIPKVAKDIAIARSYGDLRENFEYKAAKEAQTILFHRRDELMAQLRQVTPTDFKGFPSDKAGAATTATLEYTDGRRETYHILGEWDGDTTLGIISLNSRMAQALVGHVPGDELTVPAEHGETTCRLVELTPLPDTIRDWIAGRI